MFEIEYVTPIGGDAHHDVPLSNLAVSAFNDSTDEFIAERLFPNVPAGKQSDQYYTISKEAFLRVTAGGAKRAPRTEARRIEFEISSDAYFAHNYALAGENALEDLANADIAVQLRQNTTRLVSGRLRREQEIRIANLATTAANLGSGVALTGTSKWNDYLNSTPISDVTTAHAFVRQNTGMKANTMVIDEDTFQIVRRHPDILELYKYTAGGQATEEQLKSTFQVANMLIGAGVKENALEGGTSSITNIWGNNVLLAHVGPATGLQTATLGLRFGWRPAGFPAAFGVERKVERGAGSRKVEIVEVGHFQDEKIVAAELGYLISGTL